MPDDAPRCSASTQKGAPCSFPARPGSEFCGRHGGGEKRIGRHRSLDQAMIDTISAFIAKGVPAKYAASASGISEASYHSWRERGELYLVQTDEERDPADEIFLTFLESTTRARSEFIAAIALTVTEAAEGYTEADGTVVKPDAKVGQWLLERRGGTDWRQSVEVDVDGHIRTEAPHIPDDDERIERVAGILQEIGMVE